MFSIVLRDHWKHLLRQKRASHQDSDSPRPTIKLRERFSCCCARNKRICFLHKDVDRFLAGLIFQNHWHVFTHWLIFDLTYKIKTTIDWRKQSTSCIMSMRCHRDIFLIRGCAQYIMIIWTNSDKVTTGPMLYDMLRMMLDDLLDATWYTISNEDTPIPSPHVKNTSRFEPSLPRQGTFCKASPHYINSHKSLKPRPELDLHVAVFHQGNTFAETSNLAAGVIFATSGHQTP